MLATTRPYGCCPAVGPGRCSGPFQVPRGRLGVVDVEATRSHVKVAPSASGSLQPDSAAPAGCSGWRGASRSSAARRDGTNTRGPGLGWGGWRSRTPPQVPTRFSAGGRYRTAGAYQPLALRSRPREADSSSSDDFDGSSGQPPWRYGRDAHCEQTSSALDLPWSTQSACTSARLMTPRHRSRPPADPAVRTALARPPN